LTLSRDESRVKLTRLVVESANAVLVEPSYRSSRLSAADESDDGSVLVDSPNVKDAWLVVFPKIFPPNGAAMDSGCLVPALFGGRARSGELPCG
jgi:hypothetical protein